MAERRKSAEAVRRTRPAREGPVARLEPGPTELDGVEATAHEHKGRRAGKRSDPAFRPTTIFVRKETQRRATRLLEDQDAGKDFSDLVEELLANWIVKNSHA
jgi:hypothetical protein